MKPLILIACLTVVQTFPPFPRKASDSATSARHSIENNGKQKQKVAAPAIPTVYPDEAPATERDADQQSTNNAEHTVGISKLPPVSVTRGWPDWGLWVFNLLLVIVGGFQVWLLFRTFGAIKRQADNMDRQTGILKESVQAANVSAKAAQENLEIIINKERARLRIEMADFLPWKPTEVFGIGNPIRTIQVHFINYELSHYAPTPAFITESGAKMNLSESSEAAGDYGNLGKIFGLPEIIFSDTKLEKLSALPPNGLRFEDENIESIQQERLFIHFCGFVKYKDVFDRVRETRFHFRWKMIFGLVPAAAARGQWVKCGPPEDNCST